MNNGFLEALKNNSRPFSHSGKRISEDEVRLVLYTDKDGDVLLRIADKKGNPICPDFTGYSGPMKTLLRSIEQIRKASQFTISWGDDVQDDISICSNRHLIYLLVECGRIYDVNMVPIQYVPERKWTLDITIIRGESLSSPCIMLHNSGDYLKNPVLLGDSFALAESKIVRIEPVGENFASLKYFKDPFENPLLEKYLSVLCSTLDNVEVSTDNTEIVQEDLPVASSPTIVIDKITEDKALYFRVMRSVNGIDPDFMQDFSLSKVAIRTSQNHISIRPLEDIDIDESAAKILSRAEKCCPGGRSAAKEIFLNEGNFIIPAHTAEPFLFSALPYLASEFKIIGIEKLKGYKVRPGKPKLNLKLGSGIDFLEAEASIDVEGERFTLADFLRRYRKDNYITLSDGDRAIIDEGYIKKLERLFSKKKDGCKVSYFDLPEIASLLETIPNTGVLAQSRKFYEGFNELQGKRLHTKGMNAELRPYQKFGVKWMEYLYDHSIGGCLADDMGLGKTIQTITLLTKVYPVTKSGKPAAPSLIVMPKSLLFNWKSEIERFAPHLDVHVHYGPQRDPSLIPDHQLILTSYGMVRSDIAFLKDIRFQLVILDESQNIKNSSAQVTQAVLLLQADKRFALSGTPVENNLTELYSLFRFLNPAMFGTLQEFTERYAAPIHKDADTEILAELRRKIYPFMLRRTKNEVLEDLPDRIDQKIYVDMEPQHASFYEKCRRYFYDIVHDGIEQNGIAKSQFVILQALSELRRIASIPESMSDGAIESPKIQVLMDSLEEAVTNGHKVVVAFNFIAGIEKLGDMLEEAGIGYTVMTGSTQDRQGVVSHFQSDESCRVLLMTMKTGGVGLNLTAADTIYIFEPWWNKAEEEQAIGRLHRIGQKSSVMTFSLITRGTIEEKICLLQEQKSQLIDALICSDSSVGKKLSEEDINYILQ